MPVNIKGNIHYRTSEVYKKVGISRSTLMRWLKSGTIKEPYRDRRGWRLFERFLAFGLLVGFSLFYLGHFIVFLIVGPVTVDEPNRVILWFEITVAVSIMAMAMHCLIGGIREEQSKNNKESEGRFKLKDGSS